MRKLLFNSLLAICFFAVACDQSAREMENEHVDTPIFIGGDTLAPVDRVDYDMDMPDTIPTSARRPIDVNSGTNTSEKPKPGGIGKVDSIKNSYPPKK